MIVLDNFFFVFEMQKRCFLFVCLFVCFLFFVLYSISVIFPCCLYRRKFATLDYMLTTFKWLYCTLQWLHGDWCGSAVTSLQYLRHWLLNRGGGSLPLWPVHHGRLQKRVKRVLFFMVRHAMRILRSGYQKTWNYHAYAACKV